MVFCLVGFICEDEKGMFFFELIWEVYMLDFSFINVIYEVVNKVNNFMGKLLKKSLMKMSFGVSLFLMELVEE